MGEKVIGFKDFEKLNVLNSGLRGNKSYVKLEAER